MNKTRNYLLDLLKLLAILMVIITHCEWSDSQRLFPAFPLIVDMAVPVFLIISAYLRTKKLSNIGLKKYLSVSNAAKQFYSIMPAYIIICIFQIIFYILTAKYTNINNDFLNSPIGIIKWFITGSSGYGSYYIPILIQLIFYFPLLAVMFRKPVLGLSACAVINLCYDMICYYINISDSIYRLLIFRYTLIIGFGIFLGCVKKSKRNNIIAFTFFAAGLSYIIINTYVYPCFLFKAWKSTSMFVAPYVYSILYFAINNIDIKKPKKVYQLGKATYHIFLVQMVYFIFAMKLYIVLEESEILYVTISIILCVISGYIFYLFDNKLKNILSYKAISHKQI